MQDVRVEKLLADAGVPEEAKREIAAAFRILNGYWSHTFDPIADATADRDWQRRYWTALDQPPAPGTADDPHESLNRRLAQYGH